MSSVAYMKAAGSGKLLVMVKLAVVGLSKGRTKFETHVADGSASTTETVIDRAMRAMVLKVCMVCADVDCTRSQALCTKLLCA